MGMFEALNKSFESPFARSADFEKAEFINLEALYTILGGDANPATVFDMWINTKSKFGEHGVLGVELQIEGEPMIYNVSIPSHLNGVINSIRENADYITAVNEGKCGVQVYQYHSKTYNKDCYSVKFVDLK